MSNSIIQSVSKPVNFSVRLIPDLSASAFRTKTTKELGLWHALRAINKNGSGVITLEGALEHLAEFNYTRSTVFNTLKLGEGKFWVRFEQNGRTRIEIYGWRRVFETYSTYPYNSIRIYEVPAKRFATTGARRRAFWASIQKPKGVKANPIPRGSLKDYTGVQIRTQQRYDTKHQADKQVVKFARWRSDIKRSEHPDQHSRIGNVYHNRQFKGHKGQLLKVRHATRSYKSDEARELRVYFDDVSSLMKCKRRREPCLMLTTQSKRQIKGRVEYEMVMTLC